MITVKANWYVHENDLEKKKGISIRGKTVHRPKAWDSTYSERAGLRSRDTFPSKGHNMWVHELGIFESEGMRYLFISDK